MISGIVAVDSNWGIGRNNGLLFKLKKDMAHFKALTNGRVVAMGYNTLLSFPDKKPLFNRVNLVLAPEDVIRHDCFIFHKFEDILAEINKWSASEDVYIIGGGMFYRSMLPYYDKIYVTKVLADGEATVFFPNLDIDDTFEITDESDAISDGEYQIKFVTYERRYKF